MCKLVLKILAILVIGGGCAFIVGWLSGLPLFMLFGIDPRIFGGIATAALWGSIMIAWAFDAR